MIFMKRFPTLEKLLPVYSIVVVVIYSWSLLRFFWRLPSLLFYSTAGEIAITYAYLVAVNFLESIVILLALIILSIILPGRWFFDRFVTKSVLLVSLGLWYLGYIASHISAEAPYPYDLIRWSPAVAVLIFALVFLLDQVGFLRKIILGLADSLIVFLFISIPISVISLLVVIVRNIF
jgi:hypothetical protein